MFESLTIEGYRAFQRFEMSGLGRVNLLVGKNNSGKSSVLEAIYLLASRGDPTALWQVLVRRGERLDVDVERRASPELYVDVSHLFHGHDLRQHARFGIVTTSQTVRRSLTCSIEELPKEGELALDGTDDLLPQMGMVISGSPPPFTQNVPLTVQGGVILNALSRRIVRRQTPADDHMPAQYVTTESLSPETLTAMWNDIVLTENEERVLAALRFLEPRIERVAAISSNRNVYYTGYARGGFRVKMKGIPTPVPIGSLGDGTWRMLALAIALIKSRNGVLLVDEIDTGLHYSVMTAMWRLIYKTSKEFNIQVFATTHSHDCVQSIASICDDKETSNIVTIQRMESDKGKAIRFNEAEIVVAASREIELR